MTMYRNLRRWFWRKAHNGAEFLWHWIWYKKLQSLEDVLKTAERCNVIYSAEYVFIENREKVSESESYTV